jgi:hypothetical protein
VKRTPAVLLVLILLLFSSAKVWSPPADAQQAQPAALLLPPTSIQLTAIPAQLPPGGSGVVTVQLVDADGNPSPARAPTTISLFSSNSNAVTVSQQVTIGFGRSHADAEVKAGIEGSAVLTATADGLLSGSAKVSVSVFSDFALSLVPMNNPVSPGDSVYLRVGLVAGGRPFETPDGVQVTVTTSIQSIPGETAQVQPGSSSAYLSITVPSDVALETTPFLTVTAAAEGYTSATTGVGLSQHGSNPQEILVGPPRANLTASSDQLLSVSLFDGSFEPSSGSLSLDLFSSNSSVVKPLASSISMNGTDAATFPVYAVAAGTVQITAVAPGMTSIPLVVNVVDPFKPTIRLSLPPEVRAGEAYSFSVGFYNGAETVPYGPAAVHLSSSNLDVTVPASVEASSLGYAVGTLTPRGGGTANITAVLEGTSAATAIVVSVFALTVAPVQYTVTTRSDSGSLAGIPVNFTYGGRTSAVSTNAAGSASFDAFNDTATVATVPSSVSMDNRTFYFTGWSNGVRSENVSLLSSSSTFSITAEYFRSVVQTTYSLQAESDGNEPVAGLQFNVSSRALGENFTLTTNSKGFAQFVLPNSSSFTVSVPELFQPSGQTRYSLLTLENTTKNVVDVTASAAMTIDASYGTYYQLEASSPIGTVTGSGWYRSGSTAAYSVDQTSSGGPLVFQRFAGWSGSFSSSEPSGSTAITSPEFITAQWTTDNTLLFVALGSALAAAAVVGLLIFRLKRKQSS